MAVLKCKMCGGALPIPKGSTIVECEFCQSLQTLPSDLTDEKKIAQYEQANSFRRNKEFDNASALYTSILVDKPNEAEAYWLRCLCRYGIEYVVDPVTQKRIPTCHKIQHKSILDDADYLAALQYAADASAHQLYIKDAQYIDTVQNEIRAISAKEEPYDIFICYKETDALGNRTQDSDLAHDIYDRLTAIGYKVFYSRVTLKTKLAIAYEPYIYAALTSAKIMLVVGTKPEYFTAEWVKNEWSRYLNFMVQNPEKQILSCYQDMNPEKMPPELSKLQSLDMKALGAMHDLTDWIKRTLPLKKETEKETVVIQQNANTATTDSLLKRMFIYLEDGDWANADQYSERVLDIDPENAKAYLGKLMAELRVPTQEQLKNYAQPFDNRNSYQKAYRYADSALKRRLEDTIAHIKDRNRIAQMERVYTEATNFLTNARRMPLGTLSAQISSLCKSAYERYRQIQSYKNSTAMMEQCRELMYADATAVERNANTEETFQHAANLFHGIPGYQTYKDCLQRASSCSNQALALKQERIYLSARQAEQQVDVTSLNYAIQQYSSISDYKDSAQRLQNCRTRLTTLQAELRKKEQIEAKKAARRAKKQRKKAKRKKLFKTLLTITIVSFFAFSIIKSCDSDNSSENTELLQAITLTADQDDFNIGDTVTLSVSTTPSNPAYVASGADTHGYYNSSEIQYYLRNGEENIHLGEGESVTYTFTESGEYLFWAKYCPHSWTCEPEFDIVSEDISVNVNGHPISTIEDLQALSNSEGDYQLTGDIDLTGIDWTPIENFTGKFSGGGHTIKNLTINSDADHLGFFANLNGSARDIVFENATINATGRPESVGILCGTIHGSASNITVSGTVSANKGTNVGGIIGLANELPEYITFKNLLSNATITGSNRVGGLIGAIEGFGYTDHKKVLINTSSNNGTVNGKEYVGGLFGYILVDDTYTNQIKDTIYYSLSMTQLINNGAVNGQTYVGGIIGYGKADSLSSSLSFSENHSTITAQAYVGCIAGKLEHISLDACSNENSTLTATGSILVNEITCAYVGGYVGFGTNITNCTNTVEINYTGNGRYVGGVAGYVYQLSNETVMENVHNTATINGQDYLGGLFGRIDSTGYADKKTFTLQDCSNSGAISGKNFVGGLIGDMYLDDTYTKPLHDTFHYAAYLSDLSNTGAVTGQSHVGGILGYGGADSADSVLKDSTNTAAINAKAYVGCIAGQLEYISLENCSNEGSTLNATGYVTEDGIKRAYVGGYVGHGYLVNKCTNTVEINYTGGGRFVGGIAGYISAFPSDATMENLHNTATIKGYNRVGGIFGEVNATCFQATYKLTLLDFSNEGTVSGADYVGGLIGYLYLDDTKSSSIHKDYYYTASIDAMSNTGNISGSNYVGGIFGYAKADSADSIMTDITATGSVSGKSNYNSINGKVENITVE